MKKMISIRGKYKIITYRNLTVFHKGFERAYRRIVFFPEIRMAGKWLQDCGFEPGDKVLVTVSKNQIILEKEVVSYEL
ncbi:MULTISPECIES: SymE family type I addiction module toxin [unclassified Chryseobacterium]|jgi:toxic protein SymE|uniref:SymE family type I addiction module toxin n=1 Tax=unclassified Chryseobacterium TaxID=2593645 RepID=UPI002841EE94|nr:MULTISPECIES: SymE family type I addiction module toxin [unclassified Chryseobacterium]MDR3022761.1 type I toxin-antitoxin system SymE family toxin [Chryseobacterium sp.]